MTSEARPFYYCNDKQTTTASHCRRLGKNPRTIIPEDSQFELQPLVCYPNIANMADTKREIIFETETKIEVSPPEVVKKYTRIRRFKIVKSLHVLSSYRCLDDGRRTFIEVYRFVNRPVAVFFVLNCGEETENEYLELLISEVVQNETEMKLNIEVPKKMYKAFQKTCCQIDRADCNISFDDIAKYDDDFIIQYEKFSLSSNPFLLVVLNINEMKITGRELVDALNVNLSSLRMMLKTSVSFESINELPETLTISEKCSTGELTVPVDTSVEMKRRNSVTVMVEMYEEMSKMS